MPFISLFVLSVIASACGTLLVSNSLRCAAKSVCRRVVAPVRKLKAWMSRHRPLQATQSVEPCDLCRSIPEKRFQAERTSPDGGIGDYPAQRTMLRMPDGKLICEACLHGMNKKSLRSAVRRILRINNDHTALRQVAAAS